MRPKRSRRSHRALDAPIAGTGEFAYAPDPYSFGGGAVDPGAGRSSSARREAHPIRSTFTSPDDDFHAQPSRRAHRSHRLRPQIVQALGLLETEEIQQRMDIAAEERDDGLAIVMMFEWLPAACSIQDKLKEIVELEHMSRMSILRQEQSAVSAFLAWVHELLEDARLSMLVNNTLHRQQIPSPQRVRSPPNARGFSAARLSFVPNQSPRGETIDAVPRGWRVGESILKPKADATYFGAGEGYVGSRLRSASRTSQPPSVQTSHIVTPRGGFRGDSWASPSVHFAESERTDAVATHSRAGDPRFLCYHPPHSADMAQRRAASEDRQRRSREEHAEISRLAAQGTLMYGREEEELREKIARQRALAGQTRDIYGRSEFHAGRHAPSRAPPPPPVHDKSGLNSPPRQDNYSDDEAAGHIPWYQPTLNRNIRPYAGQAKGAASAPNAAAAYRDASEFGAADESAKWHDVRDASVRATQSRLNALYQ